MKKFGHLFVLLLICSQLMVTRIRCGGAVSSAVKFLPGFDGPLPFNLHTGYIGVGESEAVQLFYYFFESESDNPKSDPLLLWLTGGPGCSGLSGAFYEIGPMTIAPLEYNGSLPTLISRPHSWTKVANIIFVDLPVGTGFSYATNPAARHSNLHQASKHAYQFLLKWLNKHEEFAANPVYVAGDSYSGLLVPIISLMITNGNENGINDQINLKGYILGNPNAFSEESNYRFQFLHGMGIISDELFESLKKNCEGVSYTDINPEYVKCYADFQTYKKLTSKLTFAFILDPLCTEQFRETVRSQKGYAYSAKRKLLDHNSIQNINLSFPGLKCLRTYWYDLSYVWANKEIVRDALHVRKDSIGEWFRCKTLDFEETTDDVIPYHAILSAKGYYRSLIYSGDHDAIRPFLSTQTWIRSLNYSIADDWRPWMVEDQVAGYTRSYMNNMTFVTVKGAGHTAPEYKSKECLEMVRRWLSHEPL